MKTIITFILVNILGVGAVNTKVYEVPTQKPKTATSTISVTKTATVAPKPDVKQKATSTSSSVSTKKTATTTTSVAKKPVATKTQPEQSAPPFVLPKIDFERVNLLAQQAIVNILCTTKNNGLSPISGTGVVVSPSGVIVTNAHIAQYFLLKDFIEKDYVQCTIRTGSPAYPTYTAEIMYISPTWISDNKTVITDQNPKGNGENDFAFLRITGKVDGSNLPKEISHLIPNIREYIVKQESVLLISYPAGFLGGQFILNGLNISSSLTKVNDFFTFKKDTVDILDVSGTIISQRGSSGGAVIDSFASLLGMITISSDANTTDKRELGAITLAHINRALQREIGVNLDAFLKLDPSEFSKKFLETTAPTLTKILTDQISSR